MIADSSRLRYRYPRKKDAVAFYEIYSDARAMRFRNSDPLESAEQSAKLIWQYQLLIETKQEFRICVIQKEDDKLIGTLWIKPSGDGSCVIGYSLGYPYWGNGYGKEMVGALIQYLTEDQRFLLATAECHKDNVASLKILRANNFAEVWLDESTSIIHFERSLAGA